MSEAVERDVPSGALLLMGTRLEPMIPFSAGHRIIRQGKRDLTLAEPISDILLDQMIDAGCVARVMTAWVGIVSQGAAYCFRRAMGRGIPRRIEMLEYKNFTIALVLPAGAIGVQLLPTYITLGSDLKKKNGNQREFQSPANEDKMIAVRALRPDVAIIHACPARR
jgi:glutaconate CoA-transferase subunit A